MKYDCKIEHDSLLCLITIIHPNGWWCMHSNSYLIVDRIGTQMIYEPLVPGTGGIIPASTIREHRFTGDG